jgi:hypothetical protein
VNAKKALYLFSRNKKAVRNKITNPYIICQGAILITRYCGLIKIVGFYMG